MRTATVLDGGWLTTVQDVRGRPGLGRYGVAPGGALDAAAARLAGRLVGNDPDTAVLEMTWSAATLRFEAAALVAVAGADLGLASGHHPLTPGHAYRLAAGTTIGGGGRRSGGGIRAYLAVAGGWRVEPVLGSASTDRRSGFGGFGGRPVATGDALAFDGDQGGPRRSAAPQRPVVDTGPLRVIPTSSDLPWFGPDAVATLVGLDWTVADDADRVGLRLTGGRLPTVATGIASLGVPRGAIQVPPSGEPIITLADGPVTGGYPIVGVVAGVDLGRLGQAGPGDHLRFTTVDVATARALAAAVPDIPLDIDPGDLGAGWAG